MEKIFKAYFTFQEEPSYDWMEDQYVKRFMQLRNVFCDIVNDKIPGWNDSYDESTHGNYERYMNGKHSEECEKFNSGLTDRWMILGIENCDVIGITKGNIIRLRLKEL